MGIRSLLLLPGGSAISIRLPLALGSSGLGSLLLSIVLFVRVTLIINGVLRILGLLRFLAGILE